MIVAQIVTRLFNQRLWMLSVPRLIAGFQIDGVGQEQRRDECGHSDLTQT